MRFVKRPLPMARYSNRMFCVEQWEKKSWYKRFFDMIEIDTTDTPSFMFWLVVIGICLFIVGYGLHRLYAPFVH